MSGSLKLSVFCIRLLMLGVYWVGWFGNLSDVVCGVDFMIVSVWLSGLCSLSDMLLLCFC